MSPRKVVLVATKMHALRYFSFRLNNALVVVGSADIYFLCFLDDRMGAVKFLEYIVALPESGV